MPVKTLIYRRIGGDRRDWNGARGGIEFQLYLIVITTQKKSL